MAEELAALVRESQPITGRPCLHAVLGGDHRVMFDQARIQQPPRRPGERTESIDFHAPGCTDMMNHRHVLGFEQIHHAPTVTIPTTVDANPPKVGQLAGSAVVVKPVGGSGRSSLSRFTWTIKSCTVLPSASTRPVRRSIASTRSFSGPICLTRSGMLSSCLACTKTPSDRRTADLRRNRCHTIARPPSYDAEMDRSYREEREERLRDK